MWYYLFHNTSIIFDQTTKYIRVAGILLEIIQNSTIRNPTLFSEVPYNCTLYGDGSVQHFGNQFPEFDPA